MFNPIEFLQKYLINWIDASRGFYENAIKASEYCFKAFWDPWLTNAGSMANESAKVEEIHKIIL
jgi:hypothetical protein